MLFLTQLYRAAWKLSAAFFYLFAVFFRRSFRIRRFTLETASSVASGLEWDFTTYARLWDKLTEPVEFHEVTVPDEDGDYTFTAYFSNVGDELLRKKAEKNYWKNLTANFIAQKPART